jgi:hypothetical protein
VEHCLKWKLRKDQAAAAKLLVVAFAWAWSLKWNELVRSVACLLLARYSNLSLAEKLEAVGVLEVLPEELDWQEWVMCLLMDPVVEVLEQKTNCTGIRALYLLLQSRICRYPQSQKCSTVFAR